MEARRQYRSQPHVLYSTVQFALVRFTFTTSTQNQMQGYANTIIIIIIISPKIQFAIAKSSFAAETERNDISKGTNERVPVGGNVKLYITYVTVLPKAVGLKAHAQ